MAFAFKHLNIRGKVIGLQREDKLEIPEEALREGLINALCHRTYDSSSGTVSLAIYDDRVEIENPGRLPNALSVESMKDLSLTQHLAHWAIDQDSLFPPYRHISPNSLFHLNCHTFDGKGR